MKIALVNNFFLPRISGSAHLTKVLASNLASLGHDVLVITSDQGSTTGLEEFDGYSVLRLKCRELPQTRLSMRYDVNFAFSRKNYRILSQALQDFKPDIIHQHGQFFDLTWMTSIWARKHKVPVVLTVHTPLIHPGRLLASLFWIADEILVRPFLALGRGKVLVVDKFMRNYVSKRYHLKFSEINVIPLAIDVEKFHYRSNSVVREKYELGDDPVILSIGHVIPLRNRIALVEAMPIILKRHPRTKVLIVGDLLDSAFVELAKELNVEGALKLIGPIPHDQISDFFAAATLESHDLQGFGLGTSTLEVMASEVPVVAVVEGDNFPGIEFVDGRDIVMAPIGNTRVLAEKICDLIDDPEAARKVGMGERKFVEENLSSGRIVEKHLKLYQQLVDENSRNS
jgi:glycosyltransferase involved in cell wall biosynthesis